MQPRAPVQLLASKYGREAIVRHAPFAYLLSGLPHAFRFGLCTSYAAPGRGVLSSARLLGGRTLLSSAVHLVLDADAARWRAVAQNKQKTIEGTGENNCDGTPATLPIAHSSR